MEFKTLEQVIHELPPERQATIQSKTEAMIAEMEAARMKNKPDAFLITYYEISRDEQKRQCVCASLNPHEPHIDASEVIGRKARVDQR